MKKQIDLQANYKIIKTSNEILAKIYCEVFQIKNYSKILENIKNGSKNTIKKLTNILKDYNGIYLDQLIIQEKHNKIPAVLRNQFAALISGQDVIPTFKANYLALGNDATIPTDLDITLGNETLRGEFTNRYSSGNTAYLDKFFSTNDVAGNTYLEVGVFVDGTASIDSGYLLSRVNINEQISANETLTINVSITINSAT